MSFSETLINTYEALVKSARLLGSKPGKPLYTASGYNAKALPFMYPNTTITNGSTHQGETTLSSNNVSILVLFHSKDVNKKARLLDYNFTIDLPSNASGEVVFQIVGVQSITGTPSYSDINVNSMIEYDANSNVTLNGTIPLIEEVISYSSQGSSKTPSKAITSSLGDFGLVASKNQYFAILAKDMNGNGVTVRCTLNWYEE
jgi:hypothetical protein